MIWITMIYVIPAQAGIHVLCILIPHLMQSSIMDSCFRRSDNNDKAESAMFCQIPHGFFGRFIYACW